MVPAAASQSRSTQQGNIWPTGQPVNNTTSSKNNSYNSGKTSIVRVAAIVMILVSLVPAAQAVINTGNPDAKRLYDDLLSNYNKLVRPVQNTTDPLTVRIKLKLSQLIDVVSTK